MAGSVLLSTVMKSFLSGSFSLRSKRPKSSLLSPNLLTWLAAPSTQVHVACLFAGYLIVAVGFTCIVRCVPALIDHIGSDPPEVRSIAT